MTAPNQSPPATPMPTTPMPTNRSEQPDGKLKTFEDHARLLSEEELVFAQWLATRISRRVGKAQAITAASMIKKIAATRLENPNEVPPLRSTLTTSRIGRMMAYLRLTGVVPCLCSCGKGYFVMKEMGELDDTITHLKQRIRSIRDVVDTLMLQRADAMFGS